MIGKRDNNEQWETYHRRRKKTEEVCLHSRIQGKMSDILGLVMVNTARGQWGVSIAHNAKKITSVLDEHNQNKVGRGARF